MTGKAVFLKLLCAAFVPATFNGCISDIDLQKMKINANIKTQSKLLNLKNVSPNIISYQAVEQMLSKGFFDTKNKEYGFYTVNILYNREYFSGGALGFMLFNALTLFVPSLLGFPVNADTFNIAVQLNIFDSNGEIVQRFVNGDSFVQRAGIYFGHNPTKKAAKRYAALCEGLFNEANKRAAEINEVLQTAGLLTPEKTAAARRKMFG